MGHDLEAGEQLGEMGGDEVLEREERRRLPRPAPTGTNRGTLFGTFTRAKWAMPAVGVAHLTARFSERPLM